jgi:3-oxoacyl-[acyl-carrier protein] reductase
VLGLLNAKVAFVTGAGSGMGRSVAVEFAREGASVVAFDLSREAAEQTVDAISRGGGSGVAAAGDVTNTDYMERAVALAIERFGALDVMANVAGVFDQSSPCIETTEASWDRLMAINVKGTFIGTRLALTQMLPRKSGSIVNMASIASLVGEGGGAAYTTSKAAIGGFTRQVACEVAAQGVRVNAVAPGLVHTNLFDSSARILGEDNPEGPLGRTARDRMSANALSNIPMGRGAEPIEIARVFAFLASSNASYITGALIPVDGGYVAR